MDWGQIGMMGVKALASYATKPKAASIKSLKLEPYKHQPLSERLRDIDPDLQGRLSQQSIMANDLMRGRIPRETREMIEMLSAEKAWAGGFGTSERAGNLTARDLGLYSLQLQKTGSDMASGLSDMEVRMAMDDARMEYEGWASNAEIQYEAHAMKVNADLAGYQTQSASHATMWDSLFKIGGYAMEMNNESLSSSEASYPATGSVNTGWNPSDQFVSDNKSFF